MKAPNGGWPTARKVTVRLVMDEGERDDVLVSRTDCLIFPLHGSEMFFCWGQQT